MCQEVSITPPKMVSLSLWARLGWAPAVFLLMLASCQWCSSDYNVVIPEICHLPQSVKVNLSWVHEMVHLGIRDDESGILLNIAGPEEICDGSEGLLKFISMAYADPAGTMIASLEPNLCPTAATFCQLRQQPIISWTCPEGPNVLSLKPSKAEVIVGIQRLINYFNWKKVAFAKSRSDGSPFCDELGVQLQELYYAEEQEESKDNVSIVILGNYEDLSQLQVYSSIASSIDSLLLCVSYGYGFTDRLFGNEEERMWMKSTPSGSGKSGWTPGTKPPNNFFGRLPLVILPEWPLPMEFFSPEVSTLALITNPHPFPPSSYDFELKSWEIPSSGDTYGSSSTPYNKMIETLLAQMILKSLKIGLERDRTQRDSSSRGPYYTSSRSDIDAPSRATSSPPTSTPHATRTQTQHLPHSSRMSFYFSLAQYEQGRWHPLINLPNGDKSMGRTKNTATERESFTRNHHHKNNDPSSASEAPFLTWIQILSAAVVTVLVLAIISISLYVRNRSRNQLYGSTARRKFSRRHRSQGPYKIILTSNDVVFGSLGVGLGAENNHGKKLTRSPFGFGNRGNTGGSRPEEKPDLLKVPHGGIRKNSSVSNMVKADPQCLPGGNKARYKGDLVHLRNMGASAESLQLKMKTLTVLETLHGLRHENITAMLGCLTESRPALVWEYCSRGSLYDIIQQNDIKLDWAFKLSLLTDLVRGMRHLHLSLVRVHGNLSSKNCVVDARWVLKITDYGLTGLYHAQGLSPSRKSSKELLWTAPELLRDEALRKLGTQTGDVYSFAIIIQEVLVRGEPFCMLTLSSAEILEKLKHPPPLIRPSVSKGVAPPEAINIMRQCWAELPDMRPDFMVIHDLFKTLNHGRKANIVDTMFQMLEKYSNNLEELIRERTEQLDLEKKKTEQLLNRMLPSTVAEKLKLGLPVDPEEFSEVTIYFSDIVGFTTISAYSTPFEVVDLLNDLYTCFDATINDYNVYKVETIGDAYMVVGGAPVWSRDHADQIATMALDLLHQSGKFRIRHLPYTPLRLRIGLHTGPCCAGVVGLTMPRYCLFGDTVNTASRMESTGSAWRIHISGETKAKLDSIGGYVIQYRGMTDIKGKGQMPTFWLLGKEGFDKELPKPPGPNDTPCYLDEKSIMYGRTGIVPDTSVQAGNEFADPSSPPSTLQRITPKAAPKYGLLSGSGEPLRSLSPAEQVAHQLLNGKPTARGLRRQFSLDQGSNVSPSMSKSAIRKAPSLEETSEYLLSTTTATTETETHRARSPNPSNSFEGGQEGASGCEGESSIVRQSSTTSRSLPKPRTLSVLEESPTLGRKHMMKTTSLKEEPDKQYEFQ